MIITSTKIIQLFRTYLLVIKSCTQFCLVVFGCWICLTNVAFSEEQELSLKQMLLTPGDLTEAHADIETKCESCHVHFDKTNQTPLCLDCHENINQDIIDETGFHGLLQSHQTKDCKSCHSDHQGRDFDIRNLDRDNFDHTRTNFILEGEHQYVGCNNCHVNQRSGVELADKLTDLPQGLLELPVGKHFRFKEHQCNSCHVDFHKESLGNKCENCHNTKEWKVSQFDHSKTDFSLDGKHEQLSCNGCHSNNQFEKLDVQCQSCHLAKEPHLGVFGKKCNDCHTTKDWKNDSYNHFKKTGYHLKDSHVQINGRLVKCIDCHFEKLKPQTKCLGCHRDDDIHQGNNGNQCQACHNQKSWNKTNFVHDLKSTGFKLIGGHKKVSCDSCHIPGNGRNKVISQNNGTGLVRECVDCHQVIDPHFSKLGKDCGSCHQTENWRESVKFNHDFTNFPLTASHQLLVCESCHLSSEFSEQSQKCVTCHKMDDVHEQVMGETCESCHDTSVWGHWQFDHQQQTKFPLNGSHKNLECALCHNKELPEPLEPDKDCYGCHRSDDIHNGGFGSDCQQCHDENKFDELIF